MRVAIYSRVSTDGQEKEGTSLDSQESGCVDHARDAGWEVVACERDASSGASLDRPGLGRVRDLVRSRQVDAVLCYAVDRLSRDQNHIGVLFDEAKTMGVRLEFVTENFEDTPVGRFILSVGAFVAELEREKILERTTRGKTARARSGRLAQAAGKGIYGYVYNPSTGKREIHPDQAVIVRRIFDEFVAGSSVHGISVRLNADLIPAFGGGEWHALTVRRMLANETYTGRTVWRRTKVTTLLDPLTGKKRRRVVERDPSAWIEIPDVTPKIVEPALYGRAHAVLEDPERKRRGKPSQSYLLSGRTRCASCGARLTGHTENRGRYHYYRCTQSTGRRAEPRCRASYIRKSVIEESIREELIRVLTDPERLLEEARRYFETDSQHSRASEDAARLQKLEEKQRRLIRLYVDGLQSEELLDAESDRLRKEREVIERRMRESGSRAVPKPQDLSAQLQVIADSVRAWVANASSEDFALLAQALDLSVVASSELARVTVSVPVSEGVSNLNFATIARTSA